MKSFNRSRRHMLKGAGALIALPALESFGVETSTNEKKTQKQPNPPKRMVFLGMGYGVTNETWFPSQEQKGANYELSKGLAPLASHKKDFTIVQGCTNQYTKDAHYGSTFWLTGANRYGVPGQKFSNTISADQVAAKTLGQETRFSSLRLDSHNAEASGHGPGLSLSWDENGKPMSGIDSPLKLFHAMFSEENLSIEQRKIALNKKQSVLDAVITEAKRLQHGLSKTDTHKLEEYFQSSRDIETQLGKEEQWMTIPKPKATLAEPPEGIKGKEEIAIMYDLIAAAFQTDNTRVMSYRLPGQDLLKSLDVEVSSHNISHYGGPGPRMVDSQKRDHAHSTLLARFFDKLKSIYEADGSRLFDHTTLVFGSNIRSIHYLNNCPTLIAGGGSNIKLGQNLVLPEDTPLCNVWLTLLQGSGIDVAKHGDSTGIVKELIA